MIMTLMSTPMQEEHSETESAAYNRWKKSPALVLAVPAVLTYTRTSPKGTEDAYGKWQPSRTVEEPVSKASAASESSTGATAGTDRPRSAVARVGGRGGTTQNHAGARVFEGTWKFNDWTGPDGALPASSPSYARHTHTMCVFGAICTSLQNRHCARMRSVSARRQRKPCSSQMMPLARPVSTRQ
jgi:hypothetical protein